MLSLTLNLDRTAIKLTQYGRLALFLSLIMTAVGTVPASAFPVQVAAVSESLVSQVKIICEPNGVCYRSARRRPVARWIYGDEAFSGPGRYVGPGNYGDPASHRRRLPLFF